MFSTLFGWLGRFGAHRNAKPRMRFYRPSVDALEERRLLTAYNFEPEELE